MQSNSMLLNPVVLAVAAILAFAGFPFADDETTPPVADETTEQDTVAAEPEASLPFSMPIPEGWRTETIPFPLGFAPDLPYVGLEELRFSPGMFDAESEQFWSYAFIWWVNLDSETNADSLSIYLDSYFHGLADAVAESRELEISDAHFASSIEATEGESFSGYAETFDAFVTLEQVTLNIRGDVFPCPDQERLVLFFALSPQDVEHAIWDDLDAIRTGFSCETPE